VKRASGAPAAPRDAAPRDDDIVRSVTADRSLPGGKLEYAVLVAVWDGGAITGRELHDRVGAPLGLGYTTTARVLDRLHAKGLVRRAKEGKVFRYRASAPREEVERARLSRTLSSVLREGPRPALATLVEVIEEIDPGLLDELTRTIKALRRSRREP
jgi:predicted transcriptional regulator